MFVSIIERARYATRLRQGRQRISWIPTAAVAAIATTVVIVGSTPVLPLAPPTLAASADLMYAGMPDDEPAFFNPDSVAVAADGTLAVLERYADEADVVWLKHPDGAWVPKVRIPRERIQPDASSEGADPTALAVASVIWPALRAPNGVPEGDRLTSISDVGFLDSDHLAVVGADGVSIIDLTPELPVARLIAEGVRAEVIDRDAALAVVDDGILISSFDEDAFATGHPAELQTWSALAPCADAAQEGASPPGVVKITDPFGDADVAPATWKDSAGNDCRRLAKNLVADESGGAVIEYTHDTEAWFLAYRPLDDRPTTRLTKDWSGYVGPGVEAGGRLLFTIGNCLKGFEVGQAAMDLPKIADRSWYTESTDDDECRQDPGTPGFIGADVESADEDAPLPEGGSSSGAAPEAETCVPPRSGVAVLDLGQWAQKPLAVGADGSLFTAAEAEAGCSSSLWSLDAVSSEWTPVGGALAERTDAGAQATTMFAMSPYATGDGAAWFAPGHWAVVADDGASRFAWAGPTNSYRALTPRIVETSGATIAAFGSLEVDADPDPDRTKLVVDRDAKDVGDFEIELPGIRDLVAVREAADDADTVVMALCDAIVSFDDSGLESTEATTGWYIPPAASFTVLAGDPERVVIGESAKSYDCDASIVEAARDAHSGSELSLRPTAVDALSVDGGLVVAYAETGTFAGERVSRVRILDADDRLGGGGTGDVVYTVGCDDDPAYDKTCLGDLAALGLEASDVAISADGDVAVSTISTEGWGPVLLFRDGDRRVVRLDPGMLASGVAWSGDRLIVTDAARGDVVALTLAD